MTTPSTTVTLDYPECRSALDLIFRAGMVGYVESNPGQGKTSMIKDHAEEKGPDYGLFEINCSLANQPDFMGWFYHVTERYVCDDGSERKIEAGRYTVPYFLFDKRSGRPWFQFKNGVIVFEEYGQADIDLKRSLGQCFLERRVGQHLLPQDFDIVALSNLQGGRDAVTKDYDFLINRRAQLRYQLGMDSFLVYAHRTGMLPETMAFSSIPQHDVFSGLVPKEQGSFLTPRSLEGLDKVLKEAYATKTNPQDPLFRTIAAGIVGQGAALQYLAFLELRSEIPTVAQIVRDPSGTKVPDRIDMQMFVVFNMADAADKKNIDALITYMSRLRSDMSVAFYRNALLRDRSLMACKSFGDWAVANKTLIEMVNKR